MKNIKNIAYAFLFLLSFSCEDILDQQPLNAISEEAVWNDPDMAELYVNARYDKIPHGYVLWAGGLRLTALTDESYHMHQGSRLTNKYTQGEVTPTNMHLFGGFWIEAYDEIRNLNAFLENVNESIGDPTKMEQLISEVRFLRAWYYTELFARYGAVPLLTNTVSIEEASGVVDRTPVSDIVAFLEEDLEKAIPALPIAYEGRSFGKATKGAAIALKARALLYAASPLYGDGNSDAWQKVAAACEELFDLNAYSLSSDYQGMFLDVTDPEIIFFRQFIGLRGPNQDFPMGYYSPEGGHNIEEWRLPNGNEGWSAENPLMNLVDQYETLHGEIPVLGYTGPEDNLSPQLNPAATSYDPENPYANRDPRLTYSVFYDGSLINGREIQFWECGTDSRCEDIDSWWNGALLDHTIKKGLDLSWEPGLGLASSTPYIYMRLSEFYLTYAEAQYHLGNMGIAEEYVNRVRSRSGVEMPPIESSLSGMDFLDKIKHERRIELAFEGNRWYDARRWKDAETDFATDAVGLEVMKNETTGNKSYRYFIQQKRSYPESHYLFPIPQEEINKTDWTQNPGY